LLLSQGCCFIQSLLFSYVLREDSVKFSRIYFGSLSAVRTTWYFVRTLISQQHPSRRRDLSVRTPINVLKLRTVQDCIHPDVMANRPAALQSSRRSQCFSASVRTTCDPVQTMSSIRQERAYQVQPSGRQPSWFRRSSFIYGSCVHQFNRLDVNLQGPDAPSLIMVILFSQSATVRTLGQHRPDAALLWKLSALSWRGGCS
jgi:hypothetical protein